MYEALSKKEPIGLLLEINMLRELLTLSDARKGQVIGQAALYALGEEVTMPPNDAARLILGRVLQDHDRHAASYRERCLTNRKNAASRYEKPAVPVNGAIACDRTISQPNHNPKSKPKSKPRSKKKTETEAEVHSESDPEPEVQARAPVCEGAEGSVAAPGEEGTEGLPTEVCFSSRGETAVQTAPVQAPGREEAPGQEGTEGLSAETVFSPQETEADLSRCTVEEARRFIDRYKLQVDPGEFVCYFDSRGWLDKSGQPVRNWQKLLRSWHSRHVQDGQQQQPAAPCRSREQQYEQREYEDAPGLPDWMREMMEQEDRERAAQAAAEQPGA